MCISLPTYIKWANCNYNLFTSHRDVGRIKQDYVSKEFGRVPVHKERSKTGNLPPFPKFTFCFYLTIASI